MASKKKQKDMVFHQERATAPATATAASSPPSSWYVTPKPGKASEGGVEQAVRSGAEQKHPTSVKPQSDTLPPENTCRGVTVTLENHSMWNVFFRCGTEMILTEQGSRMFPYCRFRISGLQPSRRYTLMMDVQPLDNSHYRWTGKNWQAAGKGARHAKSQPFAHPESPATGQHWMQSPVSFYRMKLTNNISDRDGNTILHPMHRYLPRLHVVQTDKAAKDIKLSDPGVITFSFSQTEFMAVTAYQNAQFVQLKVDYNPFAKGLKEDGSSSWGGKLKANSRNLFHKEGGVAEQLPVKESLKSLLANHKPRASKAAESKPSVGGDLKDSSTTNKDPPAATAQGQSLGSVSHPAQKLFSELIREAHVSLQRCNLEQLGINHSGSLRAEPINTKNSSLKAKGREAFKDSTSVKAPPRRCEIRGTIKDDGQSLNSLNCNDGVGRGGPACGCAPPEVSQNSSEDLEHRPNPDATTETATKQHKRPARLPLPALALFLRQHSKKTKNKPDSLASAAPPERLSGLASSAASFAHPPWEGTAGAADPSEDLGSVKPDLTTFGCADPLADVVFNVSGQTAAPQQPGPAAAAHLLGPRTDDCSARISESPGPEPRGPDSTQVLPGLNQPFCTFRASLTTSSLPPTAPPPLHRVLCSPNSPQTPPESSTPPLDSPTLKSSLPDPECSSFGYEPMSPASSPEPLPHLPASIALELDSAASEAPDAAGPPEDSQDTEDPSVFKWHTVLPPPESFVDTSFTTFQSPLQTLPEDPDPQSPNASTPAPDPPASFPESEQSLPFPAELSPLALQLPLSPTFSSIDGDGLSPTPSLADLVQFLSTDVDLRMGVEFSNTEAGAVPCLPVTETHEPSQQVHPLPASKPCKRKKKKVRQRRLGKSEVEQEVDDSTYRSMQPNLEEVEEQLFISFTSKEALKLHLADSSDRPAPRPTPDSQRAADSPGGGDQLDTSDVPSSDLNPSKPSAESLAEMIASFQKILLRDLKLMKHRQVIHPVLQEVGLKMNLLDPTLAIDLQYLGVRLPIPPPGTSMEPLSASQGVSAAFVSRTGKTTDVTQIKGWRAKFTLSETPPTPSACRPEAGLSSEPQKKNLSAFCSDMLDEYLESEGKLIDERAASFSQLPVEPLVYELPTRSTSYVRTLDHVLKKQTADPASSDLISGFIPPSKRPRFKEPKPGRRGERKQKGSKQSKLRPELAAALGPEPSQLEPWQPAGHAPSAPPSRPESNPIKRRRRLKPRTSSQTLSPSRATVPPLGMSRDLAPLESDSELGGGQSEDSSRSRRQPMTRALQKQKVLEDGAVWEGLRRTSITTERAAITLTSLFTQTGFVSENPTVPIQLSCRRAPPCLNEFCRLGCVCLSLSRDSRISHCGRPACMFGCSCLKQKVVLLKNLDGSDSSPSSHHGRTKKKRRRRMKMAYVLKEADSVSQPAERVRTLWRRDPGRSDPEPVRVPEAAPQTHLAKVREDHRSCARVRGYSGKIRKQKVKPTLSVHREATKGTIRPDRPKPQSVKKLKKTSRPPPGEALQALTPSEPPLSPPAEPTPKPSKRLFIRADFKWKSEADRTLVLMELCEAMSQNRLDRPFWIKNFLIHPTGQSVEGSGAERCIQYHVNISRSTLKPRKSTALRRQVDAAQVGRKVEPLKERNMKKEYRMQEAEPVEDWQREVEEGDITEEDGFTDRQVDVWTESSGQEVTSEVKVNMALPFLTGISPAGFLSANRKAPGGTDQPIQVNGKLYPLAKIQLGRMGALHPANRLAAYLTGRVSSSRQQQPSLRPPSSSSSSARRLGPTPLAVSSASSVVSNLAATTTNAAATTASPTITTTASSSVTPPRAVLPLTLLTSITGSLSSSSSAPPVNPSLGAATPKAPQVVLIKVPPPPGTVPVVAPRPPGPAPGSQRMLLKPVQMASGIQFYRRPDGKLVKLVPVSQLRAVTPTSPAQTGPSCSSSLLSPSAHTVRPQAPPVPSSPSPSAGFLSQKGTCTFKILPADSSQDPIIVTCAKAPPKTLTKALTVPGSFTLLQTHPSNPPVTPVKLLSLKAPVPHGAEEGVEAATASVVATGAGGLIFKCTPPEISPTIQTPSEGHPTPPLLLGSKVTPVLPPGPEPEPAQDPVELDIICVDEKPHVTTETQSVEVTSSSETENSSDFRESESDDERAPLANNTRLLHTALERLRRVRLRELLERLRRTVGQLGEKMSKVSTLKTAVEVIQELRRKESQLKRKKRRLRRRRDEYLWRIAPSADQTKPTAAVMAAAAAPELLDEPTVISSDEERVVVTDSDVEQEDDEGRGVAMEMVGVNSWLARKRRSSELKEVTAPRAGTALLAALQSATSGSDSPQELLLEQARHEIEALQSEMEDLKSLRTSLTQQRDGHVRDICGRTGKSERRILRKLQQFSSKQKKVEEQERRQAPNQVTAGGGTSAPPPVGSNACGAGDEVDSIIATTAAQQKSTDAPPTSVSAPPTPAPVQVSPTHNAPVDKKRPRTIPNILSRSKAQAPPPSAITKAAEGNPPGDPSSFQSLVPAEVLSLVGAPLPRQPVLTLNPVRAGSMVLQPAPSPGVASVTLNIPTLTNQQIHLTPLLCPPARPLAVTNLRGSGLSGVLQLVQTNTPQQQAPPPTHKLLPAPPAPPLEVCAASAESSDQIKHQDQTPPLSEVRPTSWSYCGSDSQSEDREAEPESRGEHKSLPSLLDEFVFLNQQVEKHQDAAVVGGAEEEGHTHSPWMLQLDSDSDTDGAGPNLNTETMLTTPGSPKGGVLAPPPLLQMKVGRAKVASPGNREGEGTVAGGEEGQGQGGVAWRPMPRLVPLGLRGNAPS